MRTHCGKPLLVIYRLAEGEGSSYLARPPLAPVISEAGEGLTDLSCRLTHLTAEVTGDILEHIPTAISAAHRKATLCAGR